MPRAQDSPAAAAVGHRRGCLTWHRMLVRFWRPGFLRAGACSAAPAAAGGGGAPAGWPAPPPVPAVPPPPPCARTGPAMPCAAWLGWEPGLPDSVAAAELVGAAAAPAAGAAAAAGSAPAAGGWVLATSGLVPTMRRLQLARWRAAALPPRPPAAGREGARAVCLAGSLGSGWRLAAPRICSQAIATKDKDCSSERPNEPGGQGRASASALGHQRPPRVLRPTGISWSGCSGRQTHQLAPSNLVCCVLRVAPDQLVCAWAGAFQLIWSAAGL